MIETILSTPETALGAVIAGILVLLGVINRKSFAITAKTIGNSVVTAKILKYLKSEFSDDVDKLLDSTKLPYIMDLAKRDEETLKAVCEVSAKADMKGIADVILFYNSKMKDYEFVNEEMPDKYEKILTEKLSKAILNKE